MISRIDFLKWLEKNGPVLAFDGIVLFDYESEKHKLKYQDFSKGYIIEGVFDDASFS